MQRQAKIFIGKVRDGDVTGCEEVKVNIIALDWEELSLLHICGQPTSLME
jgi:hypothetical protein